MEQLQWTSQFSLIDWLLISNLEMICFGSWMDRQNSIKTVNENGKTNVHSAARDSERLQKSPTENTYVKFSQFFMACYDL